MDNEKNKNAIEIVKQMVTDGQLAQEVAEKYFPELAESEDEKIRKWLIGYFEKINDEVDKKDRQKIIAWLETQGAHANFRNGIQIGDKVTRNEDGVLVNLSQLKRVAKPAEEYNIHGIGSKHAEGKLKELIEKQGEQKAKDEEILILKDQIESLKAALVAKEETWKLRMEELEKQGEQKPVEWSELDEEKLFYILNKLNKSTNVGEQEYIKICKNWLKSLKSRCLPQSKQEWSEEDEQYLLVCKNALYKYQTTDQWDAGIIYNWLKSLKDRCLPQPKQEWSEEDEKMFRLAVELIEAYEHKSGLRYKDVKLWLKSLRPHKQWKPSEEQMRELENVFGDRSAGWDDRILESLYNDLKAL